MNKKNIPKYFINILKWPVDNADVLTHRFAFFAEAIANLQSVHQRNFFS